MGAKGVFLFLIKIVPLALFVRSAMCKFDLPYLGCDSPLCPSAIGKDVDPKNPCTPTANTAEQKAWCEHAWVPWANGLVKQAGIDHEFKCTAPDFELMKIVGAIEAAGYVLLWVFPQLGAFILTATMAGAVHFHMVQLGDKPEAIVIQFVLLGASAIVLLFSGESASAAKAKTA